MSSTLPDFNARAQHCLDGISGDRVSREMTPIVVAELLEAQVHATLAVAASLDRLLAHLEDRAITVRSE